MITVLLVTTWEEACGIAEHSALLVDALKTEDDIHIDPSNKESLDPGHCLSTLTPGRYEIVHLNYHAALHSRWLPTHVQRVQATGRKVVITYHDTMSGEPDQPNSDHCKALAEVADAFIVHEPVADLPSVIYWRQGIPEPEEPALDIYRAGTRGRPCIGTVGFDFPWKNYDLLATCSYEAGWSLLIVGKVTTDRQKALADLNPHVQFATNDQGVSGEFVHRRQVVRVLSGCDGTAFLYLCANTGTSAAIRQGIAARKPMLATDPRACRQFRDLQNLDTGITWLENLSPVHVTKWLGWLSPGNHQMDHFAEQDSWRRLGQKYADLYRGLV